MQVNCTDPPFIDRSSTGFFLTNAVVLPLLFGIGVIGNAMTLIVFNRSYMRVQHPVFVYLTGLAAVDLLTLLLLGPGCLRDMGALPPAQGYSRPMAFYTTLHYTAQNILKHSKLWITAFAVLIRYITRVYGKRRLRWTRISASRIIVFLILLWCLLVDFPRFFERLVHKFPGHCFDHLTIWWWTYSGFSQRLVYTEVYPWVVLGAGLVLPVLLLTIFTALLISSIRLVRLLREHQRAPHKDLISCETETSLALLCVILVYVVLEIPDALAFTLQDLYRHQPVSRSFISFRFAAHTISLIHSTTNFFIYTAISRDFRKTLRRTFCCCYHCIHGDDYYEPMRCPCVGSHDSVADSDSEVNAATDNIYESPPKSRKPKPKPPNKKDKQDGLLWI